MPNRNTIKVDRLKLTTKEMWDAINRSSENVKKMVVWKLPESWKPKSEEED